MGHDIFGINRAGNEIAYARFSMGNDNALLLYHALEADKYYAGVSGCGQSSTFSVRQIEKAMNTFREWQNEYIASQSNNEPLPWDLKQTRDFIENCFSTAQKEGSVKVYFG